jgi:dGTPase
MKSSITTARHRQSTTDQSTLLSSTQSDRARLIYSASFRRLQQKAQVFSLEGNSAVRSRLTHSIEVSHIGRYIVAMVSKNIQDSKVISAEIKDYWKENNLALSNIVETACLMHDIGNPPFGHFGEAAISQWAKSQNAVACLASSLEICIEKTDETPLEDFKHFDGNPQGFRIITKLQGDDGYYGLNLTYTQLTAFIKYTHSPTTKNIKCNLPFSKKIGFFNTEADVIASAWNALEMTAHSRHPLGFLMEASDDISYCISDIEDGIEKGIIFEEQFKKDILQGIAAVRNKYGPRKILDDLEKSLNPSPEIAIGPFLNFKTCLSTYLVKCVAETFVNNYEKFVKLEITEEIISENTLEHALLNVLKVYTGKHLFTSSEAECMELSGFAIISGILEEFQALLCLNKELFLHLIQNSFKEIKANELHIHRRLFNRLPLKHLNAYKCAVIKMSIPNIKKEMLNNQSIIDGEEQIEYLNQHFGKYFEAKFKEKLQVIEPAVEWNLRAHLIVDFVSGMTDQFAMEFFQMLKGINVKF